MRKKFILGIVILALLIISTTIMLGNKNNQVTGAGTIAVDKTQNNQVTDKTTVTSADLNKHNTMSDCWVAYKTKVYDITSWLPRHSGTAEAILPYCGTAEEFEKAFTEKHGTTKASLLMRVGVFIGDFEDKGTLSK